MSEENKYADLVPYLDRLVTHMDATLAKVQNTVVNIDKFSAIRDERISEIQKTIIMERESAQDRKTEILLQINLFREEYKEKQKINAIRISTLENNLNKWKWIISGANAVVFIIIFVLQIDGLTIATGPWR